MTERIFIYKSCDTDPYRNIATEKYLLENVGPGQCVLYLWQNKNTVVIGRNQNPWAECRTSLLEQEDGKLARRLSGGGAVYHDLGNLNFTFLLPEEDYDLDKQLQVIQTACASLGIDAQRSGRNDLLVDGYKFSGNAFYHSKGKAYHHGTLLVNADMDMLSRYLTPSKAKLESKGVSSVRSRVANLRQFAPCLDCSKMGQAMAEAFAQVYSLTPETLTLSPAALQRIESSAAELGSWQWLYGPRLSFSFSCSDRFDWGSIEIQLQVESGRILQTHVYSDSMDWTLSEAVVAALNGCRFHTEDMCSAITNKLENTTVSDDLRKMLQSQQI